MKPITEIRIKCIKMRLNGATLEEIGNELFIDPKTAHNYCKTAIDYYDWVNRSYVIEKDEKTQFMKEEIKRLKKEVGILRAVAIQEIAIEAALCDKSSMEAMTPEVLERVESDVREARKFRRN
ncbi:MAG: hypothetical protein GWN62_16745 [Aliifodinibius sp.]|nr:hypothetical protein [Fodinibius sp.]